MKHLLVEGYDKDIKSGGGTNGAAWVFSLDQVRSTSMFLAFGQNGKPLTHDHGFPVRLIVPGFYGCSHIKWVTLLSVVDGAKTPPTSQMNEFRSRVHMKFAPRKSSLRWSAAQGYSATAERVEIWRNRITGDRGYKAVGLLWGGPKATDALQIRFPPLQKEWQTVQHVNMRPVPAAWSQWCHAWHSPM